ncbi:hypothetical protein PRIPAC_96468 [Pristionchus pacificus]|uniref:Uncharacterized protein n=1 Tax=Pristionchus pacificus TaxID=54126 RepID=A0A2A6B2Z6_PRIPA|nr:hypothetical protein PRIPAC_96468 [Pristionchus pacificus]|eukprot:PDM60249.1 hypothetical protein PRIPAC_54074 [Pristionchus pacificus]
MCTASGMDKLIAEVHARLESIPMGTFVSKLYPPESPIALPAHLPSLSESDESLPTTQSATAQADRPEKVPEEEDESEQLTPNEMRDRIGICKLDVEQLEGELEELKEKAQHCATVIDSPILSPISHAETVAELAGALVGSQNAVEAMIEAASKSNVKTAHRKQHKQNLKSLDHLEIRLQRISVELGAQLKVANRRCIIEQEIMKMTSKMQNLLNTTPAAAILWAEFQREKAEKKAEEERAQREKEVAEQMLKPVPGRKTKKAARKGASRRVQ